MKKLILIIVLLPALLFGQNIDQLRGKKLNDLNDTELISYWKQAQENGYSIDQIKILARAQGVSEAEITQFEQRILDPRFRSATKDVIPRFEAEQLIQDRATSIQLIENNLIEEMKSFPVVVDNIQIENIVLPPKYIQSIETKQTEKNLAAAEEHKLERQRLEALREVNTADAKAQGIVKVAEAEASAIRLKGEAEAAAIAAKAKALKNNPSN